MERRRATTTADLATALVHTMTYGITALSRISLTLGRCTAIGAPLAVNMLVILSPRGCLTNPFIASARRVAAADSGQSLG